MDVGFKATTTAEVAHRAGVSIGAPQSHFRTKNELLTAAVAHSFDRRIDEFGLLMANLDPASDRLDAAIDLLWSMFSQSTFTAWHELWVAARTDPGLARAVIDIDRQFAAACDRAYAEIFPTGNADKYRDPPAAPNGDTHGLRADERIGGGDVAGRLRPHPVDEGAVRIQGDGASRSFPARAVMNVKPKRCNAASGSPPLARWSGHFQARRPAEEPHRRTSRDLPWR